MKTITEIADEIGVSRQAVHKKIKQEPLSTSLQKFTSTKGNTVYIENDGESLIKSAFIREQPSTEYVNRATTITAQYINSLQKQVEQLSEQNEDLRIQLNKERDHSREQTDKLSNLAAQLAELTRNNQILLGAEQSRSNPALLTSGNQTEQTGEPQPKKKGFFNFFKR